MRTFFEVARQGFRRYATYRGATTAGIFTNTIFGFIRAYTLLTLFRYFPSVGGYDVKDTLTYTWMTQGLMMMAFIWGWFEVAERIRSGNIATELYRPIDYQGYWLAHDLGRAFYHAIFRGIPPFLIGAVFFSLRLPESWMTAVAFPVSLVLAVVTSFGFRFLYNLGAFWLLDYRGIGVLSAIVANVLSGFIVPVAFFPGWLADVAAFSPFPAMIQIPIDIFLEKYRGLELVEALATQAVWALALLIIGRLVMVKATRRLVVQGG